MRALAQRIGTFEEPEEVNMIARTVANGYWFELITLVGLPPKDPSDDDDENEEDLEDEDEEEPAIVREPDE
jgi:hypothetical protein